MDHCHHTLNHLVLPNAVEFLVSLPWRLILLAFPIHQSLGGDGYSPWSEGVLGKQGNTVSTSIAGRLRHLQVNTKVCITRQGHGQRWQGEPVAGSGEKDISPRSLSPLSVFKLPLPPPPPSQQQEQEQLGQSPCQVSRLTASSKKIRRLSGIQDRRRRASRSLDRSTRTPAKMEGVNGRSGKTEMTLVPSSTEGPAAMNVSEDEVWVESRQGDSARFHADRDLSGCKDDNSVRGTEPTTSPGSMGDGRGWNNPDPGISSRFASPSRAQGRQGSPISTPPRHRTTGNNMGIDVTPPSEPEREGRDSGRRGSGGGRPSVSRFMRRAITGDSNIRVRDHLFDLQTAAPPPPITDAAVTPAPRPGTTIRGLAKGGNARRRLSPGRLGSRTKASSVSATVAMEQSRPGQGSGKGKGKGVTSQQSRSISRQGHTGSLGKTLSRSEGTTGKRGYGRKGTEGGGGRHSIGGGLRRRPSRDQTGAGALPSMGRGASGIGAGSGREREGSGAEVTPATVTATEAESPAPGAKARMGNRRASRLAEWRQKQSENPKERRISGNSVHKVKEPGGVKEAGAGRCGTTGSSGTRDGIRAGRKEKAEPSQHVERIRAGVACVGEESGGDTGASSGGVDTRAGVACVGEEAGGDTGASSGGVDTPGGAKVDEVSTQGSD
ncbi:unnamed protein product [Discosporangium mesarthrocarpum]